MPLLFDLCLCSNVQIINYQLFNAVSYFPYGIEIGKKFSPVCHILFSGMQCGDADRIIGLILGFA